jgi:hypothetical protein
MSTVATRDDLDRLGLGEFDLGDTVSLAWPPSDTSQALGRGDVTNLTFAAMLAVKFVGVPFSTVSSPALGQLELAASQTSTRVLRLTAPAGHRLEIHGLKGSIRTGENAYTPAEDLGTVYIDTTRVRDVVARAATTGVVVSASEAGLNLAALVRPIEVAPLERLDPPVMEWAQHFNDPWLVDLVTSNCRAQNSWSRLVAAGMLARLATPSSGDDARAWAQAFVSGKVDQGLSAPRRWVRSLNERQIRSIEELSLAEVDALHEDVEMVASDVDKNVEYWVDEWRDLCYRRDDVECVVVLLDEAGAVGRLRQALTGLDREGELLRLSVPSGNAADDERMRRIALKNPGAWWSELPSAA